MKWAILLIIVTSPTFSQHREEDLRENPPPVYIETHNLPSADTLKSRIDIMYRIPYDFFIFVKNTTKSQAKSFLGNSEIAIEILDSSKTSVARTLAARYLQADFPDPDSLKNDFILGGTSTSLSPGVYSLVVEVNDRESHRHFLDKSRTIDLKNFSREDFALCDVIFTYQQHQPADSQVLPIMYNETIPFGEQVEFLAQLKLPSTVDSFHTSVHIYKHNHTLPGRTSVFSDSGARSFSIDPGELQAVASDSGFYYRRTHSASGHYFLLSGPLHSESLTQGEYELEFIFRWNGAMKKSVHRFNVRWLTMPRSLRNPELAVSVLKYIMTEDEYQKIRHANDDGRDSMFERFWNQRDPTPATAFNEVMAEYYDRADYALSHFGTLQHSNGTETDRGRTYMIFGPPTTIHREMIPSAPPREIWEYATLHKRLVFIDESRQGNFTLISHDE
jgi:GWxTD domain-containing protein